MNEDRYRSAMRMEAYVAAALKNAEFWRASWRLARVEPDLVARATALRGRWYLLALTEDWCSDAVSTLPVLARLCADANALGKRLELRLLRRDENDDLMNAHLTRGTRSIPVVIAYDEAFGEVGWWGPRPAELQQWFYAEGRLLERAERGRQLRGWYARDAGRTAVREVLDLVAAADEGAVPPSTPWPHRR